MLIVLKLFMKHFVVVNTVLFMPPDNLQLLSQTIVQTILKFVTLKNRETVLFTRYKYFIVLKRSNGICKNWGLRGHFGAVITIINNQLITFSILVVYFTHTSFCNFDLVYTAFQTVLDTHTHLFSKNRIRSVFGTCSAKMCILLL